MPVEPFKLLKTIGENFRNRYSGQSLLFRKNETESEPKQPKPQEDPKP